MCFTFVFYLTPGHILSYKLLTVILLFSSQDYNITYTITIALYFRQLFNHLLQIRPTQN